MPTGKYVRTISEGPAKSSERISKTGAETQNNKVSKYVRDDPALSEKTITDEINMIGGEEGTAVRKRKIIINNYKNIPDVSRIKKKKFQKKKIAFLPYRTASVFP